MHALLMSRSLDIHIPLIGFEPQKNVVPGLLPMYWTIASCRSNPSFSPSSFPSGLLVTCSLWSINRITLSPEACHCLICLTRCLQNRMRGKVRSFSSMMKYWCCCWYVVPEFTFLFLQGLYARIIHVLCLWLPPKSTQHHLPRPLSSLLVFLMYPTKSPKQMVPVPPSCTLPENFAL
jgi:hypothetical protein